MSDVFVVVVVTYSNECRRNGHSDNRETQRAALRQRERERTPVIVIHMFKLRCWQANSIFQ